jgi:ribosomal protein L32
MSVRMRHTSSHTRNRRSHHALDAIKAVKGEKEGTLRLPHRIDEAAGTYRGKQIAPAVEAKAKHYHEHAPGTHHEHAHRDEKNIPKPAAAVAAEQEAKAVARPRSRSGMGGGS